METIVCIASGPSLSMADVLQCRQRPAIAINSSVIAAPGADWLLGGDLKWWRWFHKTPLAAGFGGHRVTAHRKAFDAYPEVTFLRPTGVEGYDPTPGCVRTGMNSGYVAIHFAAHLGATRILLLGYDMHADATGKHHWHAEHPDGSHPQYWRAVRHFETLVEPLQARGIEVLNCTPGSAVTAFPHVRLSAVLGA